MKKYEKLLCFICFTLLPGCNGGSFLGAADMEEARSFSNEGPDSSNVESEEPKTFSNVENEEGEEKIVDIPVEIAGAYLYCAYQQNSNASDFANETRPFNCRFQDENKNVIDHFNKANITFKVFSYSHQLLNVALQRISNNASWQYGGSMPEDEADRAYVVASITQADGVITDKRAPILDYLLGVGEIFFVGSGLGNPGDIGYCKGCPAEKEPIHNTTVGSDGLLIKTPLPYLVIPIDVPDGGTKISVELQGATEVDRVNYALVHIEGKDMERVTYSLPKIGTYEFADLMAFSEHPLPKGRYHIVLEGKEITAGNADDFLIDNIAITTTREIKVGSFKYYESKAGIPALP